MKNRILVRVMSILATVDAIGFVLAFIGAAECEGGDGCLAFSLLLLIAFAGGVLVLLASAGTWAIARKSEAISRYFFAANLVVLVLALATVGLSIAYVR